MRDVIVNDSILIPQCKTQLIEYTSDQTDVHTGLGVTFSEALQYVFVRIEMNEHKDGIKDVLNKEMSAGSLATRLLLRERALRASLLV